MVEITSKSKLAIILSKLKVFSDAKIELEQYPTDSEIAAETLWNACLQGDIDGKSIADLGCGTGILGIGALLLGAKNVYFVDIDAEALEICKSNIESVKSEYGFEGTYIVNNTKVSSFDESVDVIIQNPPFGAQSKNADREFLEKSFEISKEVIYSMHNANSKRFIEKFIDDKNFIISKYWEFDFPIKASMRHHTKRLMRIRVGLWRFIKK